MWNMSRIETNNRSYTRSTNEGFFKISRKKENGGRLNRERAAPFRKKDPVSHNLWTSGNKTVIIAPFWKPTFSRQKIEKCYRLSSNFAITSHFSYKFFSSAYQWDFSWFILTRRSREISCRPNWKLRRWSIKTNTCLKKRRITLTTRGQACHCLLTLFPYQRPNFPLFSLCFPYIIDF